MNIHVECHFKDKSSNIAIIKSYYVRIEAGYVPMIVQSTIGGKGVFTDDDEEACIIDICKAYLFDDVDIVWYAHQLLSGYMCMNVENISFKEEWL